MKIKKVGDTNLHCSQNGTSIGYLVEVKNSDQIWKPLNFREVECGVGLRRGRANIVEVLSLCDMYGYKTAMALAWEHIARQEYSHKTLWGIRIVPFKIKHSVRAWCNVDGIKEINYLERLGKEDLK